MQAIRMQLAEEGLGWSLSRMSDDAAIDHMAALIGAGRLHIHSQLRHGEPSGGGAPASSTAESPYQSAAFPLSSRAAGGSGASSSQLGDEGDPTLGADTDYGAQAAALTSAAAEGQAFCPQ
jgi:hypothetical protein